MSLDEAKPVTLESLPDEVLIRILLLLDLKSLVLSARISTVFRSVHQHSKHIEYAILLKKAGYKDVPSHKKVEYKVHEKLERLTELQGRWKSLDSKQQTDIEYPMSLDYMDMNYASGVVGSRFGSQDSSLKILDAEKQALEARSVPTTKGVFCWDVSVEEDLLAILVQAQPFNHYEYNIRLLSLSTLEVHPLAFKEYLEPGKRAYRGARHAFLHARIQGSVIYVHSSKFSNGQVEGVLACINWKTGDLKAVITSESLLADVFTKTTGIVPSENFHSATFCITEFELIGEDAVLVVGGMDDGLGGWFQGLLALYTVDFSKPTQLQSQLSQVVQLQSLWLLPKSYTRPFRASNRRDPSDIPQPRHSPKLTFQQQTGKGVIVLEFNFIIRDPADGSHQDSVTETLFVLKDFFSSYLDQQKSHSRPVHQVPVVLWSEWNHHARFVSGLYGHGYNESSVSGYRSVEVSKYETRLKLEVYDFNPFSSSPTPLVSPANASSPVIPVGIFNRPRNSTNPIQHISSDSTLKQGVIWTEDVSSGLKYTKSSMVHGLQHTVRHSQMVWLDVDRIIVANRNDAGGVLSLHSYEF